VTKASSLEVEKVNGGIVDRVAKDNGDAGQSTFTLRAIQYLFIVTRADEAARWAGADFVVDDPRVANVADEPAAVREGAIEATAKVLPAEEGSRLHWRVTGLQQGGSLALSYALPLWQLRVSAADANLRAIEDKYRLAIPNAGGTTVTLAFVRHSPAKGVPGLLVGNERVDLTPTDEGFMDEIELPADNPVLWITLPKEQRDGA
jgi:hypothetical protein